MAGKGKKPITIERVEQIAATLKRKAVSLQTVAGEMKAAHLKELRVMGEPMVRGSVKSITRFIQSCEREIAEHGVER